MKTKIKNAITEMQNQMDAMIMRMDKEISDIEDKIVENNKTVRKGKKDIGSQM